MSLVVERFLNFERHFSAMDHDDRMEIANYFRVVGAYEDFRGCYAMLSRVKKVQESL